MPPRPHRAIKNAELALGRGDPGEAGAHIRALLDAADALRHTLPAASRNDPVGVLERLLARRANRQADRAERSAAAAFHSLSPADRGEVLRRVAPRRRRVVASLLTSAEPAERHAALAILAASCDWSLVPQAAGLIGTAPADEASAAVDAIAACTAQLTDEPAPVSPAFERALAAVLDAAAQHGTAPGTSDTPERRAIALALGLLTPAARAGCFGPGPDAWLDNAPQDLELAIRSSLRRLAGPLGAARAFELIVKPGVRPAAVDRVANAETGEELLALVGRSHLGLRPLRRSALRSRLDPAARQRLADACLLIPTGRLGARVARSIPRWIELLGPPLASRAPLLEPLLAHPDPVARFAAVLAGGEQLRLDQSLDECECVALSAALRLALPGRDDPAACLVDADARRLLRRSPHASVRRLAARLPARGELHAAAVVAIRREFQRDAARVIDSLAGRIEAGDGRAIDLAARLECADELLPSLEATLRADDPMLAARAARALASARDPRADTLLRTAADHEVPRVRANAIEAAAARSRRWKRSPPLLRPDDPHHRPAATSIRLQLADGVGDEQTTTRIQRLLASREPDARGAGLWLTERAAAELKPVAGPRWPEIAARVAESARHGETARERRRATRCARRMLAVTTA